MSWTDTIKNNWDLVSSYIKPEDKQAPIISTTPSTLPIQETQSTNKTKVDGNIPDPTGYKGKGLVGFGFDIMKKYFTGGLF